MIEEWFGVGGLLAPITIMLVAAAPIGEVRFSVPLAILVYNMSWGEAVVYSLIGNFGIVPVLFAAFPIIERGLRRIAWIERAMDRVFERTRKKHTKRVERYEELAIFLLIVIPFPGTGAWMGVLVAHVFGLGWAKSWRYCYAGVTAACFLVLGITLGAEDVARRWLLRV